jgi:hypothetical protein
LCGTTRIKILYDVIKPDKSMVKVCKRCSNKKLGLAASI